jgi:phosphotransferase system IIB component
MVKEFKKSVRIQKTIPKRTRLEVLMHESSKIKHWLLLLSEIKHSCKTKSKICKLSITRLTIILKEESNIPKEAT